MCCIFTCCGWMIDLIQRLWTFTMSCCISSAVCCALVTASMSGIALGYNYSLAEYIDLKETNVSVYLKRGVFDDEIADDMDWRRSGHMPVQGHLKDSNLVTGEPAGPEEMPLRSGRRLDDSLVVSDDQHKFEGSLMRLTARPPDARRHDTPEPVTSDTRLEEILAKYPMGSLEQMKAIHGLMNMRKSGNERSTVRSSTENAENVGWDGRRVNRPPMNEFEYGPLMSDAYAERRRKINPARLAVPDESFRDPANWFLPKNQIPDSYRRTMDLPNYDLMPDSPLTRPQPIRMSTEVWRPTRSQQPTVAQVAKPRDEKIDAVMNNAISGESNENMGKRPGPGGFKSESDYEDQAMKGLPIRKKRNRRDATPETTSHNLPSRKRSSDKRETIDIKFTTSALIDKLKSSINKADKELIKTTSIIPLLPVKESSLKMISSFVSL